MWWLLIGVGVTLLLKWTPLPVAIGVLLLALPLAARLNRTQRAEWVRRHWYLPTGAGVVVLVATLL